MKVASAGTNFQIQARHCFEIVIEDIGPGFDDNFERGVLAKEIGRQHFDRGLGRRGANGADGRGELRGACRYCRMFR